MGKGPMGSGLWLWLWLMLRLKTPYSDSMQLLEFAGHVENWVKLF